MENGHDDDDDATPEPVADRDLDRTPPDGIAAYGAIRSANFRLTVQSALQHLRRAVRDGVELAELAAAAATGGITGTVLRQLSDKCREVAAGFHSASRDFDDAARGRGG